MATRRISLLVGLLCLIASVSLRAASEPSIRGEISGTELCPKSWCDVAIFGGAFYGRVDKNRAAGVFGVEVNYDELPIASGQSTAITGSWQIRTINSGEFKGTITGTLTYNGDKTYRVSGTLEILEGGKGIFYLVDGELDHGPTIPTIVGTLVQKKPQQ